MNKIIMLAAALAISSGIVTAQTSLKMAFETTDGTVSAIDAASLSMTVSNDRLVVTNGIQSVELELATLVKMYFTNESAGVELIPVNLATGEVTVYTIEGKNVGTFESISNAMSTLSAGVYIFKTTDNRTLKIAVQ